LPKTFLPVEQILRILAETPPRLAHLTAGLGHDALHSAPRQGEWSANEVLAHLKACSDVWGKTILSAIVEDQPSMRGINPRTWIRTTDYLELEFADLLKVFTEQRSRFLPMLQKLPPEGWQRTVTLLAGGQAYEQTVLRNADGMARHERAHLKQIERILDGLVKGQEG
jgi:hypothetical protein